MAAPWLPYSVVKLSTGMAPNSVLFVELFRVSKQHKCIGIYSLYESTKLGVLGVLPRVLKVQTSKVVRELLIPAMALEAC